MKLLATVLAAGLALAVPEPAASETLVMCTEGAPESLSPHTVTTTTGMNAARQMFDYLVDVAPGSTELVPALAESWTVSEDGLTYTFHLRRDVHFHSNARFTPTRTMNADDVLFSLERQLDKDHPFRARPGESFAYFDDTGMAGLIDTLEKVDDHTVRIRLTKPEAPLLANLALPLSAVLSAEYAEMLLAAGEPDRLDVEPIGTGPFEFIDYAPGVAVRYRAFDRHWRGRPKVDTLVFSITPNPSVRLAKLKVGECHLMAFPDPADIPLIEADPELGLMRLEGYNISYLAMNVTRAPFDDPRVRRAIAMAIDKAAIVEAVYGGSGVVAVNPLPPSSWAYNADVEDIPYDPDAAWELLLEAGHGDGFETELWYIPVSRPYNPNAKRMAEMIAADLAEIGIRAHLRTREWGAYRDALQNGEHAMALYGWTGDNADPDNFLHILLGCQSAASYGNNVARWCHEDYDSLVVGAKRATDRDVRAELYREAQVVAKRESPWVPLAHSVVFMARRLEAKGFVMDPLERYLFVDVTLSAD